MIDGDRVVAVVPSREKPNGARTPSDEVRADGSAVAEAIAVGVAKVRDARLVAHRPVTQLSSTPVAHLVAPQETAIRRRPPGRRRSPLRALRWRCDHA
jgi:hypothetical protein